MNSSLLHEHRSQPGTRTLFYCSTAALFFFAVVLPNSFQQITGALLVLSALLSCPFLRIPRGLALLFLVYVASATITIAYIFIGQISGAPINSAYQVAVIYIISPLLWITVSAGIVLTLDDSHILKSIIRFTVLCLISIPIFFYLFLFVDPTLAGFFQETPNVDLSDGQIAATMHVYGSLIFLCGAIYSTPFIVARPLARLSLLFAILVAVLTSGRHALMLAIAVGVFLGVLIKSTQAQRHWKIRSKTISRILSSTVLAFIAITSLIFASESTGIDLYLTYSKLVEKLSSGGGSERTAQFLALIDGISSTHALGAGHGIGVDYIRSEEYPWRYELVWVATLLRVGLPGSFFYIAPFILYGSMFLQRLARRELSDIDILMFSGLASALIASATNPYIESFSFQWMYIFPIVHLLIRNSSRRNSVTDRFRDDLNSLRHVD